MTGMYSHWQSYAFIQLMHRTALAVVLLAGGRLFGADAAPSPKSQPVFEVREMYAVGHFGNSYEVMGDNEIRAVLEEVKAWGFDRYCDWFDTDDCRDPFVPGHSYGLGEAQWNSKKAHYAIAQRLGFSRTLAVNPNHVYVTQCLPAFQVVGGPRVQGQLVCPSIPEARAMILTNYENLFRDLAAAGVQLNALMACPYDWGGCRCQKCAPWILTFAQLTHDIYERAQKHFPHIKMNMLGWWWEGDEHRLFAEWVDKKAPGWVDIMYLHIPYDATRVADVPLPKGCRRGAFVHIGYSEQKKPRDIYGHLGPVIACDRLQQTVQNLKAQGIAAINAYSEGVLDDVNKAILGGLATGAYRTGDEVLEAYARRYFGVDAETARQWAAWLKAWGKPYDVDLRQAAATWEDLLKKTPKGGWRLQQWGLKQRLFASLKEIGNGNQWTPERLAAVDRFWSVHEELHRGLWGLPPERHIFGKAYTPVPWYASWAKFQAGQAREIGKEQ
jgi:hypothetical protein